MSGAEQRPEVSPDEVQRLFERLDKEAESAGYHLNPNREFTLGLIEGMLVNEKRYGYWACPCRLASGVKTEDLDIICPCDYRDADIAEHGGCYCGLYVSQDVVDGKRKLKRVPERRAAAADADPSSRMVGPSTPPVTGQAGPQLPDLGGLRYPLWRCRVCGYLCARDQPPEVCPICRAKKDRFERFI